MKEESISVARLRPRTSNPATLPIEATVTTKSPEVRVVARVPLGRVVVVVRAQASSPTRASTGVILHRRIRRRKRIWRLAMTMMM